MKIKSILLALLIFFSFNISNNVSADVRDGQYDIAVKMLNAYEDKESMGASALVPSATLFVEGGSARLRLSFVSMSAFDFSGYLGEFTVNGVPATVISTYDIVDSYNDPETGTDSRMKGRMYPRTVEFPVDLSTNIINCSVYVPVMAEMTSGEQNVRLQIFYPESFSQNEPSENESVQKDEVVEEKKSDENELSNKENESSNKSEDDKKTGKEENKNETEYYVLPVSLMHFVEDKESMGNNAMLQEANLLINGDKMILYVGSKEMKVSSINASLIELYYDDGKEFSRAHPHSFEMKVEGFEELRPEVFGIPLSSKNEYLNVMVDPKVDVMGDDPIKARLKIDFNNMKKVKKDEASLIVKAENGSKKPQFDSKVPGRRKDKGVILEFDEGSFESDFTFYSNALTGDDLNKLRDKIGVLSNIKAYKLSALGPLEKIAYDAKSPLNDLRMSFQPKKTVKITIPIEKKSKDFKIYSADDMENEIDYESTEESLSFETDKLGTFVVSYFEDEKNKQTASTEEDNISNSDSDKGVKTMFLPSKTETRESSAIIILFSFIVVGFLSGGIYFSKKYFSAILRELAYAEELKIKIQEKIVEERIRK